MPSDYPSLQLMLSRFPTTAWYLATKEMLADPERLVCAAARVQQVAIHANDAVKRVTTAATKAAVVLEQGVYSISSFRTRT
jgi:hypothetical protein